MTELRGLGHIPDRPNPEAPKLEHLLVGDIRLPDFIDYSGRIDFVRNQLSSSCCVGFATARAAHIRAGLMGLNVPHPSEVAIYTLARALDRDSTGLPLVDEGCRPQVAFAAAARWGLVPEAQWPFDMERINTDLPLDVFSTSCGHQLTGYYRIDQAGAARSQAVRQALAQGYPVCLAIQVDASFDEAKGDVPVPAPSGPLRGGHYICAVGYKPGAVLICNSWGIEDWGKNGLAWLSDARIEDVTTTDLQVVTVARLVP